MDRAGEDWNSVEPYRRVGALPMLMWNALEHPYTWGKPSGDRAYGRSPVAKSLLPYIRRQTRRLGDGGPWRKTILISG